MYTKRFNLLYVLNDVVSYYKRYCTQNEQVCPVFAPQGHSLLSHISLSLTNDEYLSFVGYDTWYHPDGTIKRKTYMRRNCLKNLTSMTTSRHPSLEFKVLNPEHYIINSRESPWDPWGLQEPKRRISCQKRLVDIILTLGYELLQRL